MISLPIFTENMKFFAWSFLNSPKIGRWKSFNKSMHAKRGKKKKTWRGCFSQTKWVPNKLFWWMLWYLLFEHLWKTPSCRRKLHPKSEKKFYKYLTYFFGCCRAAKYPVYEFTFTFHVFYYFVHVPSGIYREGHRRNSIYRNNCRVEIAGRTSKKYLTSVVPVTASSGGTPHRVGHYYLSIGFGAIRKNTLTIVVAVPSHIYCIMNIYRGGVACGSIWMVK